MTSQNKYLVYQAFGHIENIYESVFSIISVFQKHSPESIQVIVYTDQPAYFNYIFGSRVKCEIINQTIIENWLGKVPFIHRIKIEILKDFCSKYSGIVLYMDSDTYILKGFDQIFSDLEKPGVFYMHEFEGTLEGKPNPVIRRAYNYTSQNLVETDEGRFEIPGETQMWNAGVLGFRTSDKDILEKVLKLTDYIYPRFISHIVEQMSFSYYFQKEGIVKGANDEVLHYWSFKEFRQILVHYFIMYPNKNYKFYSSTMGKIPLEKMMKEKQYYEGLPFFKKTVKKVTGKRWKLPKYSFSAGNYVAK
ncbi:MAG: hypothetical protein ACK40G_02860 [Cytophagaceae bacterium]